MIKNKLFIVALFIYVLSCNTKNKSTIADNPLEGGRYFIENTKNGDFKAARQYIILSPENLAIFDSIAQHYYSLDKEGRQQLRLSSIQINEVKDLDSMTSLIHYEISSERKAKEIKVLSTEEGWKVDLKYTIGSQK